MADIDILFREMIEKKSSDLHLIPGEPPLMRIDGRLSRLENREPLPAETLAKVLLEILDGDQRRALEKNHDLDFAYALGTSARFRCNSFMTLRGLAAVFRIIPEKIRTLEELCLPEKLKKILVMDRGLFLVTGPTGCGKTTTLAALIDLFNSSRTGHIITIENPVEFLHDNKKCLVSQRQVGTHVATFAQALKSALREDPNLILVGELRDSETIALALTAAETGILVLGSLNTNSASRAITRIVNSFPQKQQNQIRTMLASSLRAVVAQQLIRRKDGSGRIPAAELLFSGSAVGNVIRKGKSHEIDSAIETGREAGMQTMDDAIIALLKQGLVDREDALAKAFDKGKVAEQAEP